MSTENSFSDSNSTLEPSSDDNSTLSPSCDGDSTLMPSSDDDTTLAPSSDDETTLSLSSVDDSTLAPSSDDDSILEPSSDGDITEKPSSNTSSVGSCSEDHITWDPSDDAETNDCESGDNTFVGSPKEDRTQTHSSDDYTNLDLSNNDDTIDNLSNDKTAVYPDDYRPSKYGIKRVDSSTDQDAHSMDNEDMPENFIGSVRTKLVLTYFKMWFNPAKEQQCFDRCHRIGQAKEVIITKFIMEDSIEEGLLECQRKKLELMRKAFSKPTLKEKRLQTIQNIRTAFGL